MSVKLSLMFYLGIKLLHVLVICQVQVQVLYYFKLYSLSVTYKYKTVTVNNIY